jgi:thiol:disulfide interchange protein
MAKKEKTEKKKDNDGMWFVAIIVLLLFIGGVLALDYYKKKQAEIPQPTETPQIGTPEPTPPLHPIMPDAEIQAALDSGNPLVLYFYSSTCGTCVQAKDNVLALEEKLKPYNIALIKVEYTSNEAIYNKFESGTSSLIVWKGKPLLNEFFSKDINVDEMLAKILQTLNIG